MPKPFYHEQTVEIDGETIRLAINFRAIDATEQLLGYGYDEILSEVQKPKPPVGLTGKVLWGLLREHHPEIDEILTLQAGNNGAITGLAVTKLFEAAFPEEEKGKNPRKPRGASKPS
jgi:hypothetical protein